MPRVRPIRLTKAEHSYLVTMLAERPGLRPVEASLMDKLLAAVIDVPQGVNVGPMEDVLVTYSRGKVVRLAGGGYGRASRQATAIFGTSGDAPEQLKLMGTWLARQRWLGTLTIITVLNKWAEWYPRALAEAPPSGTEEGLGQNLGSTPGGRRETTPAGRPAEGLGGARAQARPHGVRED